jgi:hypothetical protein
VVAPADQVVNSAPHKLVRVAIAMIVSPQPDLDALSDQAGAVEIASGQFLGLAVTGGRGSRLTVLARSILASCLPKAKAVSS